MIGIIKIIAPFGSGSLVHDLFEFPAISGNRGIKPLISLRFDIDQRAKGALRGTVLFGRAFLQVSKYGMFSIPMSTSLDWTGIDMGQLSFVVHMVAHAHSGRAQGSTIGIQSGS